MTDDAPIVAKRCERCGRAVVGACDCAIVTLDLLTLDVLEVEVEIDAAISDALAVEPFDNLAEDERLVDLFRVGDDVEVADYVAAGKLVAKRGRVCGFELNERTGRRWLLVDVAFEGVRRFQRARKVG